MSSLFNSKSIEDYLVAFYPVLPANQKNNAVTAFIGWRHNLF